MNEKRWAHLLGFDCLITNSADRRDRKHSGHSLRVALVNPPLETKIVPCIANNAQLSDIDFGKLTDAQSKKILEKYKWRRVFWYASPQVSQATIPKEFVIETSELKVNRKSSFINQHGKSHDINNNLTFQTKSNYKYVTSQNDWISPKQGGEQMSNRPLELPVATYDENYIIQKGRQAGSYKCSFWRLQQAKNNLKRAVAANYENLHINEMTKRESKQHLLK